MILQPSFTKCSLNYLTIFLIKSPRGDFGISRDLMIRRINQYWIGAKIAIWNGPLLLTCITFKPSMDNQSEAHWYVGWNYLSISTLHWVAKLVRFENGSLISIHTLTCTWLLTHERITVLKLFGHYVTLSVYCTQQPGAAAKHCKLSAAAGPLLHIEKPVHNISVNLCQR